MLAGFAAVETSKDPSLFHEARMCAQDGSLLCLDGKYDWTFELQVVCSLLVLGLSGVLDECSSPHTTLYNVSEFQISAPDNSLTCFLYSICFYRYVCTSISWFYNHAW